jgi:hypothetical protein
MDAFEAYCLFNALRLHFTSPSYDFFKYKGKVRAKKETFDTNRSRLHFKRIARKYPDAIEYTNHLVANFVSGKVNEPPAYFLSLQAVYIADTWKKNIERLPEIVYQESLAIKKASPDVKDIFEPKEGGHPLLLSLFYADAISLETLIVYDRLFNFRTKWNNGVIDDVLWPETERMMGRYSPFLIFDYNDARLAIKKALKSKE